MGTPFSRTVLLRLMLGLHRGVENAPVMLNELGMGISGNHFGSSLVTSTFARGGHGDDSTAFLRLHTLITFLHLLLFPF